MCPCEPIDFDPPDGPSGPSIPGFGVPFSIKLPQFPFPEGFPENLLDLLNKLQMLMPSGVFKSPLNPNFGKDIFDSIMKLLDQFFPFLMLYKFFLPMLNLIICIIEVLCAFKHPSKVFRALRRLFLKCLPPFLNLFPIFALIIMIISLLLLLLALIKYIINKIIALIKAILRNIKALYKAVTTANEDAIFSIIRKLSAFLCVFQNLFVLLEIFVLIIQVFKDMLSHAFAIPPCDDGDESGLGTPDEDKCCTPDVCPEIVKSSYMRLTGTLQYLNKVGLQTTIVLPPPFNNFNVDIRQQSYQIYDDSQSIQEAFINIINAHDVVATPTNPKPVFFPTDSTYTATTPVKQAAYTVDLKLLYDPAVYGRNNFLQDGIKRIIIIKDCIVTFAPSYDLSKFDNSTESHPTGVMKIAGGIVYETDGTTIIKGYSATDPAVLAPNSIGSLENFIFLLPINSNAPDPALILASAPGIIYTNVEYIFKPNIPILFSKDIVTAGCSPDLNFDKAFINGVFGANTGLKLAVLQSIINGTSFPNPKKTEECLSVALTGLANNMTPEGAATFQIISLACLQKLEDDTNNTLKQLLDLAFDQNQSLFTIDPAIQFTTKAIKIKVDLKETNGNSYALNLPNDLAINMAKKIVPTATLGNVSSFTYDGFQYFLADLTSSVAGSGKLTMQYDNKQFNIVTIPQDLSQPPSVGPRTLDYQFVLSPAGITDPTSPTAIGDSSEGKPRRDEGDASRDGNSNNSRS